MPRLPRGLKRRRNAYYWRYRKGYREQWVPLGSDLKAAMKTLRDLKRRGTVHRSELTLYELAQQWLSLYVPMGRNEQNQRLARTRADTYLKPYFRGVRACDLRPEQLRGYRLWIEKRKLAPSTVRGILGDVRTMLRWAEDEGWIDRSPFPRRLLPRLQERAPDRLTDQEVQQLLALPDPYRYVIRLGLETGLRWGELSRVRAEDYADGMLVIQQTKSGRVRRVPVSWSLVSGRVGLLNPFKSHSSFSKTVRLKSGVARFHPHQLRHTMACQWLENGGSLAALQEILGHSSIVVTQRYARLNEAHVRAEVARMRAQGGFAEQVGEHVGERPCAVSLPKPQSIEK